MYMFIIFIADYIKGKPLSQKVKLPIKFHKVVTLLLVFTA